MPSPCFGSIRGSLASLVVVQRRTAATLTASWPEGTRRAAAAKAASSAVPLVRATAEVTAASRRPVAELRAAAARLEAAHADVATRLFTEEAFPPLGGTGTSALDFEAQALGYCVNAMNALVQSKSACDTRGGAALPAPESASHCTRMRAPHGRNRSRI